MVLNMGSVEVQGFSASVQVVIIGHNTAHWQSCDSLLPQMPVCTTMSFSGYRKVEISHLRGSEWERTGGFLHFLTCSVQIQMEVRDPVASRWSSMTQQTPDTTPDIQLSVSPSHILISVSQQEVGQMKKEEGEEERKVNRRWQMKERGDEEVKEAKPASSQTETHTDLMETVHCVIRSPVHSWCRWSCWAFLETRSLFLPLSLSDPAHSPAFFLYAVFGLPTKHLSSF